MVTEIKDRCNTVIKMNKSNSSQNRTKDFINILMDVDKNLNILTQYMESFSLAYTEFMSAKIDPMVPVRIGGLSPFWVDYLLP
jgi:hypothetical protein